MFVITATLNGLEYTQRLLACLSKVQAERLHVIVVDQGSTDGTAEWIAGLRYQQPNGQTGPPLTANGLTLIPQDRNTGAATAWNLGIRIAVQNGADKILVVGNDTLPMLGTIERLSALIDAGIQFVTGTAVQYGKPEVMVALALPHEPLLAAPDFSFFMLTPAALEMVARYDAAVELEVLKQTNGQRPPLLCKPWDFGLFDERMWPSYFEDNDFHLRLQRAGVLALRDPGAEFRHETSLTIRINPELAQQNQTTFVHNLELFKAKYGGLPHEVEVAPGSNKYAIGAKPLNVSEEQWKAMSGGHPILELSRDEAVAQAKATYARYGITA